MKGVRNLLNKDKRADKLGELWDIYDEKNELTGRTHHRGEKLNVGDYHLVVNALIFNIQGNVLLQQRSFQKITDPGMWTIATLSEAFQISRSNDFNDDHILIQAKTKLLDTDNGQAYT